MTCGSCGGVQRRLCCSFSGSAPVCVVGGGVYLLEPALVIDFRFFSQVRTYLAPKVVLASVQGETHLYL